MKFIVPEVFILSSLGSVTSRLVARQKDHVRGMWLIIMAVNKQRSGKSQEKKGLGMRHLLQRHIPSDLHFPPPVSSFGCELING